jgi:cobalt-zinc-cadmium efflux system outer membrane protein
MFPKSWLFTSLFTFVLLVGMTNGRAEDVARSANPMSAGKNGTQLLILQQFIERVWDENPDVEAAREAVEVAKAHLNAADQPVFNPELEVDAESTDIDTYYIAYNQTIDWGNRRDALSLVATEELRAAKAALISTQQRSAVQVLSALADYYTGAKLYSLAEKRNSLMLQFVDASNKRYTAGDIGQLDAALANVAYTESLMQLASRKAKNIDYNAMLITAASFNSDGWPVFPRSLPLPPSSVDRKLLLTALPALHASSLRWQSAKAAVEVSRSNQKSNPTIGIRGGKEGTETLIGLNVTVPMNFRNNFSAEVIAAEHLATQEEQRFLTARKHALVRLDNYFNQYKTVFDSWSVWQKQGLSGLNEQMDLLQRMWEAGEISVSDYLIQAKQNVNAHGAAVELEGQVWKTWINWLDASGQVDTWLSDNN